MASSWSPSVPAIPIVTDHRYSSLQQERSYLLSALATEESRAEHISRTLETTKAKLQMAEEDEDSAEAAQNLRKVLAAMTRKLKKCQKNEQPMSNNLAEVSARMQILEQNQWQKAQLDHSERVQQVPIYGMTVALQGMTLETPMSPAYGYPCTLYPSISYTISPLNSAIPSLPATPFLRPQLMSSIESGWNTPLPTPYHEPFLTSLGMSTPFNTPQPLMTATWQNRDMNMNTIANRNFQPPHQAYAEPNPAMNQSRRMSLPDPPRKSGWHIEGSLEGIGEEPPVSADGEQGRSLSMDGGTMPL
jgi:hypothetical protein